MKLPVETLDIPRALRETLEKGKPEFEALARGIHWGEGPIYVATSSSALGLTAAYAFESLLGWPVVVRSPSIFAGHALPLLKPRAVVVLTALEGESEEVLEFARLARSRGATLLALTVEPPGELGPLIQGNILVRTAASSEPGVAVACAHAALSCLATVAAHVLKPPNPQNEAREREFRELLPGQVEWTLTQLSAPLRSLWDQLAGLRRLWIVGGGAYHAAASQAAERLEECPGLVPSGEEISSFRQRGLKKGGPEGSVLFLSGSQCRAKQEIHKAAAELKVRGVRVFSLTDKADRELVERSNLGLLLPVLTEGAGAILVLSLFEWLARRSNRPSKQKRPPARTEPPR